MISTIFMAVMAFLGTNIDDLFILMLFFSQIGGTMTKPQIIAGQYLGIGTLIAMSILGALGLSVFPPEYVGLLGLVPIYLGIRGALDYRRDSKSPDNRESPGSSPPKRLVKLGVLKVAGVTIANGGDNIGIYVPLFIGMGIPAMLVTVLVFALLTALWCLMGLKLAGHPLIRKNIEASQHILVPVVFIGLGIFILLKNGTLGLILRLF